MLTRVTRCFRFNKGLCLLVPVLFLFSGILHGCDNAFIDPFDNDDKYYTIYGFLDESKNFRAGETHAFRVTPVTRRPERIETPDAPQAKIDGRVFLTDLNQDQTTELTYALEELQAGVWGHIFRTNLFIEASHRYRIEIMRNDGVSTFAETHVPRPSGVITQRGLLQQMPMEQTVGQDIVLSGVNAIWDLEVLYHLGGPACFAPSRTAVFYGRSGRSTTEGWSFRINAEDDLKALPQAQGATVCGMGIRARLLDDQWILPEGDLNLDDVSLPDNLTNVVNGYGFFGSVALFQDDWSLSDEMRDLLRPFTGQ